MNYRYQKIILKHFQLLFSNCLFLVFLFALKGQRIWRKNPEGIGKTYLLHSFPIVPDRVQLCDRGHAAACHAAAVPVDRPPPSVPDARQWDVREERLPPPRLPSPPRA